MKSDERKLGTSLPFHLFHHISVALFHISLALSQFQCDPMAQNEFLFCFNLHEHLSAPATEAKANIFFRKKKPLLKLYGIFHPNALLQQSNITLQASK